MGWQVLLIGGSSGSGKSTVARQLGRQMGVAWLQTDDLRLAAQRLTTATEQPAIHFFADDSVWSLPTEQLAEGLKDVAAAVSRAIEPVIEHHLAVREPVIIEGDGILPAMAAHHIAAGESVVNVHAVFLVESDEEAQLANLRARGRGQQRSEAFQRAEAEANVLYGEWLRREATEYNLTVLEARPFETLAERILAATEE